MNCDCEKKKKRSDHLCVVSKEESILYPSDLCLERI